MRFKLGIIHVSQAIILKTSFFLSSINVAARAKVSIMYCMRSNHQALNAEGRAHKLSASRHFFRSLNYHIAAAATA
jgi:hypothetical protein